MSGTPIIDTPIKDTPISDTGPRRIVLVTGLSGGGKASVLHALEDLGYDAVDNPPVELVRDLATRAARDTAICVDARTRGFDVDHVIDTLVTLRRNPALLPELVFVWADEATLLRRFTETRRRHPLAPRGRVAEGIEIEQQTTARLREFASLTIDTSHLPLARLRDRIERHFSRRGEENDARMMISLISFAYAKGIPTEADLVFDARFLRNPHYDPTLRPRTGLDPAVGAYIREDEDYAAYLSRIIGLVDLVLPRFVHEGKKYATIAIGCTGGRHRSVYLIERLAAHLSSRLTAVHAAGDSGLDWRQMVTHRELDLAARITGSPESGEWPPGKRRAGDTPAGDGLAVGKPPGAGENAPTLARNEVQADGGGHAITPIQAQEA
jgi:UPF0042 nucleotide-binding protein